MPKRRIGALTLVLALLMCAGCENGGGSTHTARHKAPKPYRAPPPPVVAKPDPPPRAPKPTSIAVKSADEVYLAGKTQEAYDLYRSRLLVSGNDLDAHDGLIRSAMKLGLLKKTLDWYEQKLTQHGSASPTWGYGAARAMLMSGDLEQASELAWAALRRDRGQGRLYYLLGLKYRLQASPDYKTAINALRKAVKFDRNYGPAYYQLAYLQVSWRRNRHEGKTLVTKALSLLKPVETDERFLAHELLARLLVGEKNYAKALAEFEKARKIGGDRIYERNNIGRLCELMGEREKALREWKNVQDRFGLASPMGLSAYVSSRRLQSKVAFDYTNFLPGGSATNYASLVSFLLKPDPERAVRVPAELVKWLNEIKTPIVKRDEDLDGDAKPEVLIVQTRQKWDADLKGYYLTDPTLYVFTPRGGISGFHKSQFDHFWDVRAVDFDADGKKELVFAAFSSPNILNVLVLTRKDGRYLNTFALTVKCSIGACGVLFDDLDGDGKIELMTVSNEDLWVTVYRWEKGGTFADASADFPRFYRDYVKQYEKYTPEQFRRWPIIEPHLEKARRLAAEATGETKVGAGDR